MQAEMLSEMEDYLWTMAARKRLILVDDGRTAWCTFFVLVFELEIPDFYDRKCWSLPQDHADGSIIYIDKLVSTYFNRGLWKAIEQSITDRFPGWEQAVWYRAGRDEDYRYTYRRERFRRMPHGADISR